MSYQNDFKPKNVLETLQRHHRIHLRRVVRVAQVAAIHLITQVLHNGKQACAKKTCSSTWWKWQKRTGRLAMEKRSMQCDRKRGAADNSRRALKLFC
jgi:hypothetical protein